MVLGESGKLPVNYHIQCKMINFWLSIINGSESKMVVKMYKVLHQKFIDNSYKSPWLKYIHKILINCGLGNIWAEHHKTSFNPKWLKASVKQKLKDLFINSWCIDMYESNTGTIYREIKTKFEQESYLHQLPGNMSSILCKFRLSNFKLPIVRGRYNNIPRNQRFCDFCDENLLGDEFHILLECTNEQIKYLRSKHLPKYYQRNNNMYKFIQLFEQSSTNKRLLVKLCRFLKEIFKMTNG